jgi:hypothetical protein
VTAPAEWVGRWAGTTESGLCGTPRNSLALVAEADTFSVCEGDVGSPVVTGEDCQSSWDASTLHFSCSGSFSAEGCTVTTSVTATATRSGETMNVQYQFETSYSGNCGDTPDFCEQTTATYTRISPTPVESECDTISEDPLLPRDPAGQDPLAEARAILKEQLRRRLLAALASR